MPAFGFFGGAGPRGTRFEDQPAQRRRQVIVRPP